MSKVLFSSWNGTIIDERAKNQAARINLEELNLPDRIGGTDLKAFVGWSGLVVVDPDLNVVEILKNYFQAVQRESCGRCIPCRVGSKLIADRLARITAGKSNRAEIESLAWMGRVMKESSLCELGQSAPLPLLHALEYFQDHFTAYLEKERPAAGNYVYRSILTAP